MLVLAIILAALSNFVLGAFWYSPKLFGHCSKGCNEEKVTSHHSKKTYVISFIYALIAVIGFYLLAHNSYSLLHNIKLAIFVGVFFVATSFGINYQFTQKTYKMFLIDAGYHAVQFLLYAIIFWLFNH